jgi:hypothetical protein
MKYVNVWVYFTLLDLEGKLYEKKGMEALVRTATLF